MQIQFEELTDAQWQVIKEILKDNRKLKHNLRDIVNGILEILWTETQWRNLKYSKVGWQVIYYYFRIWKTNGTLKRLNSCLNAKERNRQNKEETPSLLCIDSQSIKSVPFVNQEKGIDGNKCVNGHKRHLIVDTLGLIWEAFVRAADIHDGTKAHLLIENCLGYLERMKKVLVDDAYKKVFYDWVQNNIIGLDVESLQGHLQKEVLSLLSGDGLMRGLLDG